MGSPVSPIVCNIFMEHLEQCAISSASVNYEPTLWLRYVDDCLAVIPSGTVTELNDHLNTIDDTCSIKFTFEEMENDCIPFLDALLIRNADGTVRTTVYRKNTHTNQYLLFNSMHPLTHKLSVVRTLLDRSDSIVTENQDRIREEETIRTALENCGYPRWTITKVRKQQEITRTKSKTKKNKTEKKVGQVVLPYRTLGTVRENKQNVESTSHWDVIQTTHNPQTLTGSPQGQNRKGKDLWGSL